MLPTEARTHIGQNVVAFRFAINERVRLTDADCVGRIREQCNTANGHEYLVAYFDSDKVMRTETLTDAELEKLS
jgi:hypothetical protein